MFLAYCIFWRFYKISSPLRLYIIMTLICKKYLIFKISIRFKVIRKVFRLVISNRLIIKLQILLAYWSWRIRLITFVCNKWTYTIFSNEYLLLSWIINEYIKHHRYLVLKRNSVSILVSKITYTSITVKISSWVLDHLWT